MELLGLVDQDTGFSDPLLINPRKSAPQWPWAGFRHYMVKLSSASWDTSLKFYCESLARNVSEFVHPLECTRIWNGPYIKY